MHSSGGIVRVSSGLVTRPTSEFDIIAPRFIYDVRCVDALGELKWEEHFENLVTTQGKNNLLDVYFKGGTASTTWYVALYNSGTPVAGDTYASHAGYVEDTNYSNANRPTLTLGTISAASVDNSGNVAAFTINGTTTIVGAAVVNKNTKGDTAAAGGILYSAGAFGSPRSVVNGDTLNVTITLSFT
jgi:hypothetical protein